MLYTFAAISCAQAVDRYQKFGAQKKGVAQMFKEVINNLCVQLWISGGLYTNSTINAAMCQKVINRLLITNCV